MPIIYHDIKGTTKTTWKDGLDVTVNATNTMQIDIVSGSVTINETTYTLASAQSIVFEADAAYDKLIWIYLLKDNTLYVDEVIDEEFQEIVGRDNVAITIADFKISANQTDLNLEDIHVRRTIT